MWRGVPFACQRRPPPIPLLIQYRGRVPNPPHPSPSVPRAKHQARPCVPSMRQHMPLTSRRQRKFLIGRRPGGKLAQYFKGGEGGRVQGGVVWAPPSPPPPPQWCRVVKRSPGHIYRPVQEAVVHRLCARMHRVHTAPGSVTARTHPLAYTPTNAHRPHHSRESLIR